MPLPIPSLDDRTFEQLVAEGRALIPRYSQEWTNHNPSDPGITLLELFAFLTETALFQLNQVPTASVEQFLRLINVCRDGSSEPIDQTLVLALAALGRHERAVTAADFEELAIRAAERRAGQTGDPIARTAFTTFPDTACASADPPAAAPVVAAVVIVPNEPDKPKPTPSPDLLAFVRDELDQHRLLTTRLVVLPPNYVEITVTVALARRPGSGLTESGVRRIIKEFLHPLRGGPDGTGWPFGRTVYYSEMFQRLESEPAVDHVDDLQLSFPGQLTTKDEGLPIGPLSLVFIQDAGIHVIFTDGTVR